MVYIYLVHYAEVEPEAALLAINTLKKELSNPNQLVRANALRTMSSIRVRLIAQLVGLAVKQASVDSSPYVRKAAAHAVPKLVSYVLFASMMNPCPLLRFGRLFLTSFRSCFPLCVRLSSQIMLEFIRTG